MSRKSAKLFFALPPAAEGSSQGGKEEGEFGAISYQFPPSRERVRRSLRPFPPFSLAGGEKRQKHM